MKRLTIKKYDPVEIKNDINHWLGVDAITALKVLNSIGVTQTSYYWNDDNTRSVTFHTNCNHNGKHFIKVTMYSYNAKGVKRTPNYIEYKLN